MSGGMGDSGGAFGGGDFGGHYGRGPTSTWGAYLYAAGSVAAGIATLVTLDAAWLAVAFFIAAAFFVVMAHAGPGISAWSKERRRRKPGDPPTLYDLD